MQEGSGHWEWCHPWVYGPGLYKRAGEGTQISACRRLTVSTCPSGQPGLHSQILSQTNKHKNKNKAKQNKDLVVWELRVQYLLNYPLVMRLESLLLKFAFLVLHE